MLNPIEPGDELLPYLNAEHHPQAEYLLNNVWPKPAEVATMNHAQAAYAVFSLSLLMDMAEGDPNPTTPAELLASWYHEYTTGDLQRMLLDPMNIAYWGR